VDVVSGVLAALWLCLIGIVTAYVLLGIKSGRHPRILLIALVIISFAGGYTAHRSAAQRGASLPRVQRISESDLSAVSIDRAPAIGSIDRIEFHEAPPVVSVAGWIADPLRYQPGVSVFALVDGRILSAGAEQTYGGERPDVARTFSDADLLWTGFSLQLAAGNLAEGKHVLQIGVVSSDLRRGYVAPNKIAFYVPLTANQK
jgi:hypothetical protein